MTTASLRSAGRLALPLLVALLLTLAPRGAAAQATYQDATSASYTAAALELAALAVILPTAATGGIDQLDGDGELAFFLMNVAASLAFVATSGGIAQASSAPAEVPLVWHGTLAMSASMAMLFGGYVSIFDEREGFPIGAVIGAVLGGAMGAAWSGLNADRLAHDPEQIGPAHLMTWAPLLATSLGFGLGVLIDDDAPIAAGLLGGLFGIATCMAVIVWSSSIVSDQEERAAQEPRELSFYFPWSGTF